MHIVGKFNRAEVDPVLSAAEPVERNELSAYPKIE